MNSAINQDKSVAVEGCQSKEKLTQRFNDFCVANDDGTMPGCVTLKCACCENQCATCEVEELCKANR